MKASGMNFSSSFIFFLMFLHLAKKVKVLVAQSCLTLCDPVHCSPPGSSVHGILQARILEQVAFPSPEDLPDPEIKSMSPELQADTLPSEPQGIFNIFRWICLKIQFCWALLLGTPEIIFHSIYEKIKIRVLQQ